MSYTFAVQVPTGRELDVKVRILNLLERIGNPGITDVHALETFEQRISNNGMSAKKWKVKLPGYIFVAVDFVSSLKMDSACWQFLKRIPLVTNILNTYIEENEWQNFFESADLEPEIEIVETEKDRKTGRKELEKYWIKFTKAAEVFKESRRSKQGSKKSNKHRSHNNSTVTNEIEELKHKGLQKLIIAVQKTVHGGKTIYRIPFKLYKILFSKYREKAGGLKSMNAQIALDELESMIGTVSQLPPLNSSTDD